MVCGRSPSIRPSRFFQSLGLTPAARTAIRTWPGPGCGSGRSTISRTSGPPNWLKRAAFIVRPDLDPGCRAQVVTSLTVKAVCREHAAHCVLVYELRRSREVCPQRDAAAGGLVGAGWCCRCAGLRSGAAVRKDAELVPLWVGKYDPALIARLADVGVPGTQAKQAADLFVLLPVGWVDVEVEPVLDGLALGHVRECQRRWHGAKAVPAFRHHGGADCDHSVVFVLHLVVKDRAPEPGETAGIGTVDRKLGELTGHIGTSQSGSGSAQGHTLIAVLGGEVPRVVCAFAEGLAGSHGPAPQLNPLPESLPHSRLTY